MSLYCGPPLATVVVDEDVDVVPVDVEEVDVVESVLVLVDVVAVDVDEVDVDVLLRSCGGTGPRRRPRPSFVMPCAT